MNGWFCLLHLSGSGATAPVDQKNHSNSGPLSQALWSGPKNGFHCSLTPFRTQCICLICYKLNGYGLH